MILFILGSISVKYRFRYDSENDIYICLFKTKVRKREKTIVNELRGLTEEWD